MNAVEMVRARLIRGYDIEVMRIRSFLSCTGEHNDLLPLLQGEDGQKLLAKLVETTMVHVGYVAGSTEVTDPASRTMRQIRRRG